MIEPGVTLKFPEVEKMSGTILQLSEVSYRYNEDSRIIFSNVDLSATMQSRICIVGENGAGKTTLLKVSALVGQYLLMSNVNTGHCTDWSCSNVPYHTSDYLIILIAANIDFQLVDV